MPSLATRPFVLCHRTAQPVADAGLRVPAFVEEVAQSLGARFERMPEQVVMNVDADAEMLRAYLGTYMPRTVVEFQTIGQELLSIAPVRHALPQGRSLRVLDLGSGTGGAWMGWVCAMAQCLGVRQVQVVAVDGNADAMAMQVPFLRPLTAELGVGVSLQRFQHRIGLTYAGFMHDLAALLAQVRGQFDFILVSKHLSEFYQAAGAQAQPIIGAALHLLGQRLHHAGHLVLLDVTQKTHESEEFFPQRLARELGQYLQEQRFDLRPVLPMPCAWHALSDCAATSGCFTQREFCIDVRNPATGALQRVNSKVTYRVMAQALHAMHIREVFDRHAAYAVNDSRPEQACVSGMIKSVSRRKSGYRPAY